MRLLFDNMRLERLAPAERDKIISALKEQGLLTDEEFSAKKRQILGL